MNSIVMSILLAIFGASYQYSIGYNSIDQEYQVQEERGLPLLGATDQYIKSYGDFIATKNYYISRGGNTIPLGISHLADGWNAYILGLEEFTEQSIPVFQSTVSVDATPVSDFMMELLSAADDDAVREAINAEGGTSVPSGTAGQILVFTGESSLTPTDTLQVSGTTITASNLEGVVQATTGILSAGNIDIEDDTNLTVGSGIQINTGLLTHTTGPGYAHVPEGGSSGNILIYSADGVAVWGSTPSPFDQSLDTTDPATFSLVASGLVNENPVGSGMAGLFRCYGAAAGLTGGAIELFLAEDYDTKADAVILEAEGYDVGLAIASGTSAGIEMFKYDTDTNRTYLPRVYFDSSIDSANVFIDSDGRLYKSSSTRKIKGNIKPLKATSEAIDQLEAVSFTAKGDTKTFIGLIAEDVLPIFPELVNIDPNGEPSGVRYDRLAVILLEEIQRLRKRVEKLESKNP